MGLFQISILITNNSAQFTVLKEIVNINNINIRIRVNGSLKLSIVLSCYASNKGYLFD